jgi:small conductance mechanosensitive channel
MGWFGALVLALFYAAALLGAGLLVSSWLAGIARIALDRARLDPVVRELVVAAVRPVVLLIAVIAALESIGVELDALVALLAVAGIAVALAAQGTLANGVAGGLLLTLRPFRVGDEVTLGGVSGTVVDSNLFATTLKATDGSTITVPSRLILDQPMHRRPPPPPEVHPAPVSVPPPPGPGG